MRKRIVSTVTALLLTSALSVTASIPALANGHSFKDVPRGAWFDAAVSHVYTQNLFKGESEDRFEPDGTMTRAMLVQVLANGTSNYDGNNYKNSYFGDVPANIWYTSAVQWAYEEGIVEGVGQGNFAPDRAVTREEVATILYKYAVKTGNNINYSGYKHYDYTDFDSTAPWAQESLKWSVSKGIINGYTNTTIAPCATATRAQVAQMFLNGKDCFANKAVDNRIKHPSENTDLIGMEAAKRIALEHAGLSANQVSFIEAKLEYEHGRYEYDIEFYFGNMEYDYEIDGLTGKILEFDHEVEYYERPGGSHQGGGQGGQGIGADQAKKIALDHAGIRESDATFIKAKLDYEDGRRVYEVEFYSGNTEYDYEIDAETGRIVSYDHEIEYYDIPGNNNSGSYISEARVKEIVLARVPGARVSDIRKLKLDRDDGRMIYEGEIIYGGMEYEFEIDASTGTIIEWDVESIYD